ncbi:MAG: hypothetical protein J6K29_00695 [Clostridia bacterium]|nr:hypothetical protein [Clostridia bacterium]
MKKWLFPILLSALLLTATGCDEADMPLFELPDTVDGLTVVTSEDELSTEPVTDSVTESESRTEDVTEDVTDVPPSAETETLSAEEAAALLEEILRNHADDAQAPVEIHMTSEAELTAHMFGFSGTTVIPLSGHYAIDSNGELMLSYAIPMEGTGVCIMAGNVLYLHDGTDTALKAPLDGVSIDEVKENLLKQFTDRFIHALPGVSVPDVKAVPAEDLPLTETDWDISELLHQAFTAVPTEIAFRHVSAVRSSETGSVTFVLSGISDPVLDTLAEILSALPTEQPECKTNPDFTEETAAALVALLREQADHAVSLTLTADSDSSITEASSTLALDLSTVPELTSHMPVELTFRTNLTFNRAGIDITAPEDADTYREVSLAELLMGDAESETSASEEAQTP